MDELATALPRGTRAAPATRHAMVAKSRDIEIVRLPMTVGELPALRPAREPGLDARASTVFLDSAATNAMARHPAVSRYREGVGSYRMGNDARPADQDALGGLGCC